MYYVYDHMQCETRIIRVTRKQDTKACVTAINQEEQDSRGYARQDGGHERLNTVTVDTETVLDSGLGTAALETTVLSAGECPSRSLRNRTAILEEVAGVAGAASPHGYCLAYSSSCFAKPMFGRTTVR